MFCRLKDYCRIATCYNKLTANFASTVYFTAAVSFWFSFRTLVLIRQIDCELKLANAMLDLVDTIERPPASAKPYAMAPPACAQGLNNNAHSALKSIRRRYLRTRVSRCAARPLAGFLCFCLCLNVRPGVCSRRWPARRKTTGDGQSKAHSGSTAINFFDARPLGVPEYRVDLPQLTEALLVVLLSSLGVGSPSYPWRRPFNAVRTCRSDQGQTC